MKRILAHVASCRYSSVISGYSRDSRHFSTNWRVPLPILHQTQKSWTNSVRQESTDSNTNGLPDRNDLQHGVYEMKDPESEDQVVNVTIKNKDGKVFKIRGKIGDNLLYLAKRYDVEMEGACEASLACTTCHVYVEGDYYDKLEAPSEKEEDLLDMAPFLKENSRLGCQIILNKDLEGLEVRLPAATKNFYVDGHKPSHH